MKGGLGPAGFGDTVLISTEWIRCPRNLPREAPSAPCRVGLEVYEENEGHEVESCAVSCTIV